MKPEQAPGYEPRPANQLLQDMCRNAYGGLGKPEALGGNMAGWWSRRIDEANRVVYRLEGDTIVVFQCRSHYGQ
ncbi:MAG: Txe/YoeB family addiction module toxin [Treponema sp.]|nr:Txe/YoeB family addiction module toxin [Treponema sp.]